MKRKPVYGLLAEFETPDALLEATKRTHAAGYQRIDAFSPMPIEGLSEACGFEQTKVAPITFIGGALGAAAGFGIQYYASAMNYPLNIGGGRRSPGAAQGECADARSLSASTTR